MNKAMRNWTRNLLFATALLASARAWGQWSSQTITLRPGWNAVYLEVQPEPRECDVLFAGLLVESAWRFNRTQATVQFIDDPNLLVPNAPDWLTWLPVREASPQSRLFILEGGRAYLIKLADNSTSVTWTIRGTPVVRKPEWLADSLNFVGFPLPTNSPPTFQTFFTNSSALATNSSYRLNTSGIWVQVNAPATTVMQRGEAFWIRSTGLANYAGPLEVQLDRRVGLDFGRVLTEQTLRIRNPSSSTSRTIVLRQLTSEPPVSAAYPALAGSVPLSYWQNDFAGSRVGWTNLPTQLIQSNVPPGGIWEVRLEVRRRDMSPFTLPVGAADARYQSLLEITDTSNSSRLLVPVTAEGLQNFVAAAATSTASGAAVAAGDPSAAPHPRAGLWIGSASLTNVSQPASLNPVTPVPTASDFSFRVLVHVDANGQARLLQKVLQMFKAGTYQPANDGTTNRVVNQPGRFVLLTDDRLIPQFTGVAVRDSSQVGRRFSSAAFSFRQPIPMSGTADFAAAGARWSCPVVLDYRDPINPFVHRYHPDHDNKNERFEATPLPEGQESFTVQRQVDLEFTASDPDNLALSGWGDNQIGGVYRETITGLHKRSINISGTFRLYQASRVAVLNDGL